MMLKPPSNIHLSGASFITHYLMHLYQITNLNKLLLADINNRKENKI